MIEDIVSLIKIKEILLRFWFFLNFFSLDLSTIEFHFDLIGKYSFVFLYNRGFVVNMTITICNDTTLSKVLKCPGIGTFLHEQKLLMIPFIEIGWFHKRVNDTILSVLASTINTQVNTQMNRRPFGIFLFTINTYLNYFSYCTLLSFWCLIAANVWSRTVSSTIYDITLIHTYYPFFVILSSYLYWLIFFMSFCLVLNNF